MALRKSIPELRTIKLHLTTQTKPKPSDYGNLPMNVSIDCDDSEDIESQDIKTKKVHWSRNGEPIHPCAVWFAKIIITCLAFILVMLFTGLVKDGLRFLEEVRHSGVIHHDHEESGSWIR
jgi:hypothetical protein